MLFNRPEFFILCSLTFLVYYLPFFRKYQLIVLILSSLFFYSYTHPLLVFLLLSTMLVNTYCSYRVAKAIPQNQRMWAILGVVLNLLVLSFKYSPLFAQTLNLGGTNIGEFLLTIPLPIGISFFTFQGITLVVDVFQRNQQADIASPIVSESFLAHLKRTFLFIAFFPQLVAGPIVKAHNFYPQIQTKYLKDIDWASAVKILIMGYFLKNVIADNLKDFTFWIQYPQFMQLSTLDLLSLIIAYSAQIFADFAGYSLIAIGIGRLFGYRLPQNFNFPYISRSFSDFWRRWNMSLSSFLKEYLYIQMGGNRKGKFRTYLHLLITMALGGLWHGAAWSYLVWGLFHGILLAIERFLKDMFAIQTRWVVFKVLQVVFIYTCVTLAWLLFKLPDFGEVVLYFKAMFYNASIKPRYTQIHNMFFYASFVLVYHLYYVYKTQASNYKLAKLEPYLYGVLLFLIITNSGSAEEFIYFQF
ncbi:MAG TPA: MBOAT family protein [Microscillaceae bacterium]|nr:MBOAT family protein [Microscillaceae bacterium]